MWPVQYYIATDIRKTLDIRSSYSILNNYTNSLLILTLTGIINKFVTSIHIKYYFPMANLQHHFIIWHGYIQEDYWSSHISAFSFAKLFANFFPGEGIGGVTIENIFATMVTNKYCIYFIHLHIQCYSQNLFDKNKGRKRKQKK